MNQEIANILEKYGFLIDDKYIFQLKTKKISKTNFLHNLLKYQGKIYDKRKVSMVKIISKFNDLLSYLKKYGKDHPLDAEMINDLIEVIESLMRKFEVFFKHVNLLNEAKRVEIERLAIDKEIAKKTKGLSLKEQINVVAKTDLVEKVLTSDQKIRSLTKELKDLEKEMDKMVATYEFEDFVELLTDGIDTIMAYKETLFLPENVDNLLNSWHRRINDLIKIENSANYEFQKKFKMELDLLGIKEKKPNKIEEIVNLLKLYNPTLDIKYLALENVIYISNIDKAIMPENIKYDNKLNKIIARINNKEIKVDVGKIYNRESFIKRLRELNPSEKLEIIPDSNVIMGIKSIDNLNLPEGFFVATNPVTKEKTITDRVSINDDALSFKYKRKMFTTEMNYDVSIYPEYAANLSKDELVTLLERLNGADKVTYYDGKIITTITSAEEFVLPDGFYFDAALNITNRGKTFTGDYVTLPVIATKNLKKFNNNEMKNKHLKKPNLEVEDVPKHLVPNDDTKEFPTFKSKRKKVINVEKIKEVKDKKTRLMKGYTKVALTSMGAKGVAFINEVLNKLASGSQKIKEKANKVKENVTNEYNVIKEEELQPVLAYASGSEFNLDDILYETRGR